MDGAVALGLHILLTEALFDSAAEGNPVHFNCNCVSDPVAEGKESCTHHDGKIREHLFPFCGEANDLVELRGLQMDHDGPLLQYALDEKTALEAVLPVADDAGFVSGKVRVVCQEVVDDVSVRPDMVGEGEDSGSVRRGTDHQRSGVRNDLAPLIGIVEQGVEQPVEKLTVFVGKYH